MSNEEIFRRIRSGDKNALEKLIIDNYKFLLGYLIKLCLNEELAKDLAQETITKTIINIKKFRGDCKFSTWLIQIATNLYKDYQKKNKKIRNLIVLDENLKDNLLVEEVVLAKEREKLLMSTLDEIPCEMKEVFVLKHFYDFSYQEISVIVKCPIGTVRSRLHYCILKLREKLKDVK